MTEVLNAYYVKDLGRRDADGNPVLYCEGSCLNDDERPMNWDNGSLLRIIDKAKHECFDLEHKKWENWPKKEEEGS